MTLRCFVAIGVDDAVRDPLADALQDLRATSDLAWTRPDGWHVTLAFCGEVDPGRLDEVTGAVRGAVSARAGARDGLVRLTLGRAHVLGRALTLAVPDDPPGSVVELTDGVQAGLVSAGLPVVRRRIRPHLTLARRRGDDTVDRTADVDAALERTVWPTGGRSWVVRDVGVWRSTLGKGPARYDVVASVPLLG